MKRLEYVASATNHLGVGSEFLYDDEIKPVINDIISQIGNLSKFHNFSMLYNALIESRLGYNMRNHLSDVLYNIHADSGGLQIVTQGLTVTPELKTKVYIEQAKNSDIGMSFDEIPVTVINGRSARTDFNNRYFDYSKFHDCAIESGKNLNEQINYFRSVDSKCRPYLIAQGNCLDTYTEWVEIILNQLDGDNANYIGGCAMGSAALGVGMLEDIKKSFYYSQIIDMLPNSHMHLLGVGSIKRLFPALIMFKNGMFDKDGCESHLSYDSSTHTMGLNFGQYYDANIASQPLKTKNDYAQLLNEIRRIFPFFDISHDDFYKYIRTPPSTLDDFSEKQLSLKSKFTAPLVSISNFISKVDSIYEDLNVGLDFVGKSEYYPLCSLFDVKSKEDYIYWEKTYTQYLPSKPHPKKQMNTLF